MQTDSLCGIGPSHRIPGEKTKMTDDQFKPGDIVSLRSGGPRMTVANADGQNAFCEWFTDDQQLQDRTFALTSLRLEERR